MEAQHEVEDNWDFFSLEIDSKPASIWINLRYRNTEPPVELDTMYWACITMAEAGETGMGTETEAEFLWQKEDQVDESARRLGLELVARSRTGGGWEVTFYGTAGKEAEFKALLQGLDVRERAVTSGSRLDSNWQRYRELLPDDERWQWMQDRKTVEVLEQQGDNHEILRRVDHWAYFTSETARRAFVNEVAIIGFSNDPRNAPESDTEFVARVFRTEQTELESIHATVMQLWSAARRHGGYYDGWETSVETPPGS